ncbi:hypothetical protein NKH73_14000 [Mesorhizobium sp. M0938]|uniref:hypothetical protein n=1 Tax=unclassified Mesorhizobium TaxID=325217 RepID=UPI003338E93C
MNAALTSAPVGVSAFDERIATAWRINCQEVVESIRFVKQYRKTIDEADVMLTPTVRLHRADTVEQARKLLPWRLSLYLEHVRAVSECEQRMDMVGMAFAISSDDWRAADDLREMFAEIEAAR